MRILNATEEMSSHPVKNAQWGAKILFEDTRATKKANLVTGMGISRRYQEGKSQITALLTINIKPNGKSRFISCRICQEGCGSMRVFYKGKPDFNL